MYQVHSKVAKKSKKNPFLKKCYIEDFRTRPLTLYYPGLISNVGNRHYRVVFNLLPELNAKIIPMHTYYWGKVSRRDFIQKISQKLGARYF